MLNKNKLCSMNKIIEKVDSFKYLGVELDEK